VVGVAFLTGYFSDSAVAKLTDIADTLFGTTRSKEKHGPRPRNEFDPPHQREEAIAAMESLDNLEEGANAK
jgi:hypothetical protein